MSDVVRLKLLGPLRVERAGEPIYGFESRKALALLCYLAVQAKPVPRTVLADLFWADKPEARGRANLSRVLYNLNSLLPDCWQADRQTIELKPAAEMWLDLAVFEKLAASQEPGSLARAVDLYGGDFMAGFHLDDSPEFDTWLLTEREHWRQRVAQLLRTLIDYHTRTQQYQSGQEFAARLLVLDPWREEAHQQMMRLLALSGQRGAALAQYETCCRILEEELGVEPGEETTRLYECIRAGELSRREKLTPAPASTHPERSLRPPASVPSPSSSSTPFVARERELAQLNGFLDRALAGQGQVVFITGEAGSGKTALMGEFARQAQAAHVDLVAASGNCNAHIGRGDPYLPFREILELLSGDLAAGASAGVSNAEHARRLKALAPDTIRTLLEISPELIDILVPGPALVSRAEAIGLDAVWLDPLRQLLARRQADQGQAGFTQHYLFEQYSRVLQALARQTPLLLALDDLQWADAGSFNLLFHLGRRLAGSRLLVVGAYRPTEVRLGRDGERHPLETVVNELQRQFGSTPIHLSQADNRQFVEALLDTEPNRFSPTFREALYHHTGGHALFTVEMLRGLQECGDLRQDEAGRWVAGLAINWQTLPARVEGVIGERLGRLPTALREALQIASVAGEEFTGEVVAQVRGIEAREIVRQLSGVLDQQHRLVKGQGSRRLGSSGQHLSRYRFRHILFQKYLYDSLDEAERVYLHEAVGNTIERLYREQTGEAALELARHFEAAGLTEQAIDYLRRAGERAERLSANEEALAHFKRALALLDTLPGTPARVEQELTLQLASGRVAMSARGYAAPEVEKAFLRVRALCQETHAEDSRQLFEALSGLCVVYDLRAEYQGGRELAEQLLELAQRAQKPIRLLWARQLLGEILCNMGEFLLARTHLEWDLAFYDPRRRVGRTHHEVQDPAVSLLGKASKVIDINLQLREKYSQVSIFKFSFHEVNFLWK